MESIKGREAILETKMSPCGAIPQNYIRQINFQKLMGFLKN
jgi:hypothetical protein